MLSGRDGSSPLGESTEIMPKKLTRGTAVVQGIIWWALVMLWYVPQFTLLAVMTLKRQLPFPVVFALEANFQRVLRNTRTNRISWFPQHWLEMWVSCLTTVSFLEDSSKKHLKFHLGMTLVINRYDHTRVLYGTSTTDGVHVTLANHRKWLLTHNWLHHQLRIAWTDVFNDCW